MSKTKIVNKVKGLILVAGGIIWMFFVYNFDNLLNRENAFGTKAIIGFIIGLIMVINGIRIYLRKQ
jgi:hypothetical protein